MFELTNAQRKHFGLQPISDDWVRMEPINTPRWCTTIAYLDGTVVRKYIETGNEIYTEYELCEQLSDDLCYLQPKTAKGKPVLFSCANLKKRTGFGMCLSYMHHSPSPNCPSHIFLENLTTAKLYYSSEYDPIFVHNISEFEQWVNTWCAESTPDDLKDIDRFARQQRQHIDFHEGDVFRFKINRRLYGYGRILIDFSLMRKKKIPFWDVFRGKPLICSVYHIATERKDVTAAELAKYNSLPSVPMMDNHLYYGAYEIIGHIPIGESEDYPILYGYSFSAIENAVLFQWGKLYRREENTTPLFTNFRSCSIGFGLDFHLSVLQACIADGSNAPHWNQDTLDTNSDLRNPKFQTEREQILRHFGLPHKS